LRIIIYTGKGGVGKTSVAAATALRSARSGKRTLVMSTDAAHSLSDSLDRELSSQIVNIEENLDAIEVDVLFELEHRWKEIEKYITDFLVAQGLDDINAKEMAIMPGMELMSALFYVWDFCRSDKYDVVVMDTAPTAETLRLLSFPEVTDWYMDKVYKVFQRMIRLARVTVRRFMDTPIPTKEFMRDVEEIKERMKVVRRFLTNPEITSVRLVVNPEKMVINETKRAYTYLCLYNLTVESLVVNRLLPEDTDGFFKEKMEEQKRYMDIINEVFDPLRIFRAELFQTELVGIPMLKELGDMLFGDEDPTAVYSTDKPMDIYNDEEGPVLSLKLPFSMKEEVQLYRSGDALLIQVGNYKRNVTLPYTLMKAEVGRAEFKEGRLLIRFTTEDEDDGS
jgi:arsenite-transporting ATPase